MSKDREHQDAGLGRVDNTPEQRRSVVSRVRFLIPAGVLGVGGAVQAAFWIAHSGDATRQVMSAWYILPTTVFLVLLWWLFLSGFGWKSRLTVVGILAAAVAGLFGVFRFKEFSGDMVPQFESRWNPTAAEKAESYWKGQGEKPPAANSRAGSKDAPTEVKELPVAAADWPQFGGPQRDGIARGVRVRSDWNRQSPRPLWRHPVGPAWSSFAVVGNYAFTQEQRGDDEAVVCYDAETGRQLWSHLDRGVRFSSAMGGVGPRATPTLHGSRVYAFGGTGILNCLDPQTGAVLWSTSAVADAGVKHLEFGMSGSPLVYDDVVVVNAGGPRKETSSPRIEGRALIAYDRITGQQKWGAGDVRAAYASPILATIGGVRQIILFDALGAAGHDAADGKELWRSIEWTNQFQNNIAQPIVQPDGSVFVSSGYGTGSLLLDVKRSDSAWSANPRWQAPNQFKLKFNSGVYRDGCVYGLDEGILACFDLSTGKQRWKKGRYKYGQVLLLDDALFVISEEGDAVLVEITPSGSREIAKFHAIDGKTWNPPAISRGRLYVRNGEEAACYDLGPTETAAR